MKLRSPIHFILIIAIAVTLIMVCKAVGDSKQPVPVAETETPCMRKQTSREETEKSAQVPDELSELRKKAEDKDWSAAVELGNRFLGGLGVPKDDVKALFWLEKAAALGYGPAQIRIGDSHRYGVGTPKNPELAVCWFKEALRHQSPEIQRQSMFYLGQMYLQGYEGDAGVSKAIDWLKKSADMGYPEAINELGLCYGEGMGVERNHENAVRYYQQAADMGLAAAQYNLGNMYMTGMGVKKNPAVAVDLYKKAADQGDADAMYNLGNAYENGIGVASDFHKSVFYYKEAADRGHATAKYNLGIMLMQGVIVQQNLDYAERLFREAAELGDQDAPARIREIQEMRKQGK